MTTLRRTLVLGMVAVAIGSGCKKNEASGTAQSGTATGAGSVAVVGNKIAYQQVKVQVPWDVSDPVTAIKAADASAAGQPLKLTDGKTTVEISNDGRSLTVNGKSYGGLTAGDEVVVGKDLKVTVNGVERQAEAMTTQRAP